MEESLPEAIAFWYFVALSVLLVVIVGRKVSAYRAIIGSNQPRPTCGDGPPSVVFTLIHGTWARKASWTRPDSPLRNELCRRFPESEFRTFSWSGRNSETARNRATVRLRDFLSGGIEENPNAQHVLIAHSHGGNIALAALSRALVPSIAGLVCLATPVLVHRERQLDPYSLLALKWFAVPPAFIFGGMLGEALYGEEYIGGFAIFCSAAACLFMLWWNRRLARIIPHSEPVSVPSAKAVFVRYPGDEASLVIAATNLFSLILERSVTAPFEALSDARSALASRTEAARRMKRYAVGVAAVLLVAALIVSSLSALSPEQPQGAQRAADVIAGIMFGIAALIFLVRFLYDVIFTLVAFALAAMLVPFIVVLIGLLSFLSLGRGLGWALIANHVTAEATPPGVWQLAQIEDDEMISTDSMIAEQKGKERAAMQHSRVYESRRCLRFVGDWIAARLEHGAGRRIEPEVSA